MLAISVRQPWAWPIIHGGKNIENRTWSTKIRGRVLIHASQGMTGDEYVDVLHFLSDLDSSIVLPKPKELARGGIIGSVEIVDCVSTSDSPWFFGRYGFVLRNPTPMPFLPWKGVLRFFDVPDQILAAE